VGRYRTRVRLVDVIAPDRSGLQGRVDGPMGSIDGTADFVLRDADGGTDMDYRGTGRIDGPLARLDSRFAERLAESLIDQGLRALDARLATEGPE
jgi:carbon monoxide dehydrogenase subunit G